MESVIVPAVDVPSSFVALRSLHRRGIHTIAVSERESPEVFCSRYCDEAVRVPSPNRTASGYREALLDLAMREDVRTILPVREEDAYVLSRYKAEFDEYVDLPIPDFGTLRKVQDRTELFDVAAEAGVPVPETELLTEWTDWSRPTIVKGRYTILADAYRESPPTVGGQAVRNGGGTEAGLANPPKTEYLPPGERPDVDALRDRSGHVPLVQEYLPDTDEYSFCAMYDRGEPLATFQHRQIRGFSYSGGTSAFRKSVYDPDLEAEGLKLLDALDWHGPADVEFKRDDRTGEFKLMEVNPRFWSSVPFAVQAGADFPLYYWRLATGRADRIGGEYEVGIGGHLLVGEISYLRSVVFEDVPLVERPSMGAALAAVLSSLVRHPRFDYADRSDPCPFLRYAYNELARPLLNRVDGSAS
ncbi:carboxylate--amine ligase (plasmid) [Halorussus salilacus]|uniref:carboxylate--amine ligase n=1 Tax=Halorussus salilacus TaxID=2953750 RepID=UPI0020A19F00|nr:carboxylate--amine ligase [Halorussus salilacus]USZ69742.1 carboxylate--amine ligase [Halorussus salilacus]